jgi:putative transcriptional regulator
MAIMHHADDATLMSYAAGSLPDALAAVVSAHVARCEVCARELKHMEAIGTALFSALPPSPVQRPAAVMAVRRAEADVAETVGRDDDIASDVPRSLAHLIGRDLDSVAWRVLGLGVWHYRLPMRSGDLRLLKVGPGRRMPEHGHRGAELTLLLRGSYADETGVYRAGDLSDLGEDVVHQPISGPVEGCICLIASERPARFKGLIPRMVAPLTGM